MTLQQALHQPAAEERGSVAELHPPHFHLHTWGDKQPEGLATAGGERGTRWGGTAAGREKAPGVGRAQLQGEGEGPGGRRTQLQGEGLASRNCAMRPAR